MPRRFERTLSALRAGTFDRSREKDPAARAVAELAEWLAFPTELGDYPDEIELVDHRTLLWPPRRKETALWLFRYRARDVWGLDEDDTGVGLVGSTTFCLFGYENHRRHPDDVYALHCAWELRNDEHLEQTEEVEDRELHRALAASPGHPGLRDVDPILSVRLRRTVPYPGGEVLLARAEHRGVPGWLVLDGPRSAFVPADELPEEAAPETVALLHVGRILLGFDGVPPRRKHLRIEQRGRADDEVIERYESALEHARTAPPEARRELFGSWGPIGRHAARYVEALVRKHRVEDVRSLVAELARHWDHNSGYAELAKLAFSAGLLDVAKQHAEKLRAAYPNAHRSETVSLLAEIYFREGHPEAAYRLLTDALAKLERERKRAPQKDQKLFSSWMAVHAETLRRLFPDRATDALRGVG
jgi:tetratricopeptide (TPR) repeat protein